MIKGRRVESPSSINTYKQCPRKYYYHYVQKLPTGTSIHLIRGGVVHQVLEDFYDVDMTDERTHSFKFLLQRVLQLFKTHWKKKTKALESLDLTKDELQFFYDESVMMLQNWFNRFKHKINARIEQGDSFLDSYEALKPIREEEYRSEEFMIRGYIDIIHEVDGQVMVLDYKTSKRDHVTDAYKLQLAIYAFLYEEKHGRKPDYVGIDFLKSIEKLIPVDDELVKHAKFEIEQIHGSTGSNEKEDYPKRPSPLCKWKSGQCDFYELCFEGEDEAAYKARRQS